MFLTKTHRCTYVRTVSHLMRPQRTRGQAIFGRPRSRPPRAPSSPLQQRAGCEMEILRANAADGDTREAVSARCRRKTTITLIQESWRRCVLGDLPTRCSGFTSAAGFNGASLRGRAWDDRRGRLGQLSTPASTWRNDVVRSCPGTAQCAIAADVRISTATTGSAIACARRQPLRDAPSVEGLRSEEYPLFCNGARGMWSGISRGGALGLGQCSLASQQEQVASLTAPSHPIPSSPAPSNNAAARCCALSTPHAIAIQFFPTRTFRAA